MNKPNPGRNEEICKKRKSGMTYQAIADGYDLTRKRVEQIVNKVPVQRQRKYPPGYCRTKEYQAEYRRLSKLKNSRGIAQ